MMIDSGVSKSFLRTRARTYTRCRPDGAFNSVDRRCGGSQSTLNCPLGRGGFTLGLLLGFFLDSEERSSISSMRIVNRTKVPQISHPRTRYVFPSSKRRQRSNHIGVKMNSPHRLVIGRETAIEPATSHSIQRRCGCAHP